MIYAISGISAFIFFMSLSSLIYSSIIPKEQSENGMWLFKDASKVLYNTFFSGDPRVWVKKFGIKVDQYDNECLILREKPKYERLVVYRALTSIFVFISIVIALINNNYILLLFAVILSYFFILRPTQDIHQRAEAKKNQIEKDIPRFMDMLITALNVGLPIENAIKVVAGIMEGPLGEEMNYIVSAMMLEEKDWKDELILLSDKFQIEILSDLIQNIITSHEKGVSIKDSLERKSVDIKRSFVLLQKEKAGKLSSTIIVPIFITKLLPIVAILLIPLLINVTNMAR